MNITNIVDVIIVLVIALWGLNGLKRGVIKQGVMTIGTVLMFVIAFFLKNPVAEFLSLYLPFIPFKGILGPSVINIILYQAIAFLIVVSLLEVVLNLLIKASGILETLLKFTIVLGIPSKILGFILGVLEGFVIVYVVLFFLSQPLFKFNLLENSALTPVVLQKIPGLSNMTSGMVDTFTDIYDLQNKYKDSNDSNGYSIEAIQVMLKHKVITVDYVDKLISRGKLDVKGIDQAINQYR